MLKKTALYWYLFDLKLPNILAPRFESLKTKPRKSLVNSWMPTRIDVVSKKGERPPSLFLPRRNGSALVVSPSRHSTKASLMELNPSKRLVPLRWSALTMPLRARRKLTLETPVTLNLQSTGLNEASPLYISNEKMKFSLANCCRPTPKNSELPGGLALMPGRVGSCRKLKKLSLAKLRFMKMSLPMIG